jgi:hypothetical protein
MREYPVSWGELYIGSFIEMVDCTGILRKIELIKWKGVEYYTFTLESPDGSRFTYTAHWTEKFLVKID